MHEVWKKQKLRQLVQMSSHFLIRERLFRFVLLQMTNYRAPTLEPPADCWIPPSRVLDLLGEILLLACPVQPDSELGEQRHRHDHLEGLLAWRPSGTLGLLLLELLTLDPCERDDTTCCDLPAS